MTRKILNDLLTGAAGSEEKKTVFSIVLFLLIILVVVDYRKNNVDNSDGRGHIQIEFFLLPAF
jgi:hypothetical protein